MMKSTLALFLFFFSAAPVLAKDEVACGQVFLNDPRYFQLDDFTLYPTILRNDSSTRAIQTGNYVGPTGIQEYVSFTLADKSPYLKAGPNYNSYRLRFTGYNEEEDTCGYLVVTQAENKLDEKYAKEAAHYNVTMMMKYEMAYSDPHMKKGFAHLTPGYYSFLFGDMLGDNEKVANFVCGMLSDKCNNTADGEPRDACVEQFFSLPLTDGDQSAIDGNSQGCRALHAVMADLAPETHCPHLAFAPTEDPNGNIKCQESKGYHPLDFFTEDDLAFYEEFQLDLGIDPERGYKLKAEYGEEAAATASGVTPNEVYDTVGDAAVTALGGTTSGGAYRSLEVALGVLSIVASFL